MSDNPFKQKQVAFKDLPRQTKLATIFYPEQADPEHRKAAESILRREGWKIDPSKLLKDHERGAVSKLGGLAKLPERKR